MNWIAVGLATVSGILAAVIAQWVVGKPKEKWVAYVTTLALSFAVINALSRQFLLLELNAWRNQKNIEESLQQYPAYQQIAKYDPDAYQHIKGEIGKALRSGENEAQIEARIRPIVTGLVQKYLPRASDDAVLGYIDVVIQEIEELTSQSPELCYRFLFPQQFGPIEASKYFKVETQQADLDALAKVIRTGAENPVATDIRGSENHLQKIFTNLHRSHGEDISLFKKPFAPATDKAKFCKLTVAFYREALKLPKEESSLVLRYMLSVKGHP